MPAKKLSIIEYPDPFLKQISDPVSEDDLAGLQGLIDDMIHTMFYHRGVGLAAPQVGELKRIFVLDQQYINGDTVADPWVFVNPKIEPLTEAKTKRPEGCLSFPNLPMEVPRYEWVRVTALGRDGKEFVLDTTNNHLLSIAVQHENDHLDGKLLDDYVGAGKNTRSLKRWMRSRGMS